MPNILFVAEGQSFLVVQAKQKLEELEYNVIMVETDIDEIHKITEDVSAILIYGDPSFGDKASALTYLKDKAVENLLPFFIFGYVEELDIIKSYIPENLIKDQFTRPINMHNAIESIDRYVKKFGNHNKFKILVVDDSGAMLRNVKGWLEQKYNVILANSGAMAIKSLTLNRPDLVLLDYEMPIVDGKQVLEMIRSETDFFNIPVIFLTSRDDEESIRKVMELKVQGYLLKTQTPDQIVKTIDDFFENVKASKLSQ